MEFTTHFELNSQTARLFGCTPYTATAEAWYGVVTLYDPEFDPSYPRRAAGNAPLDYNSSSTECQHDLQFELFPLHSQLLGESLLVSFPPLINMLKSSGSSYLISGPIVSGTPSRAAGK